MGATAFFLVHNHVSGSLIPSLDDELITSQVSVAGGIIGLPMYEHLIVGEKGYACICHHSGMEENVNAETILGDLLDMLILSRYEMNAILYDPDAGIVRMELPAGK